MIDLELIVLLGALASAAVLAVAPFAVVYAVAFITLTPILGVALWLLLGGLRGAKMPAFSQRGFTRALERAPQSSLASRLGALIVAMLGAVKLRRLGPGPRSLSERAAEMKRVTQRNSAQRDSAAEP